MCAASWHNPALGMKASPGQQGQQARTPGRRAEERKCVGRVLSERAGAEAEEYVIAPTSQWGNDWLACQTPCNGGDGGEPVACQSV